MILGLEVYVSNGGFLRWVHTYIKFYTSLPFLRLKWLRKVIKHWSMAWGQFPARTSSPSKRSTSPIKQAVPTRIDESRLKAWKLTGIISLRDSGLQVLLQHLLLSSGPWSFSWSPVNKCVVAWILLLWEICLVFLRFLLTLKKQQKLKIIIRCGKLTKSMLMLRKVASSMHIVVDGIWSNDFSTFDSCCICILFWIDYQISVDFPCFISSFHWICNSSSLD